MIQVNTIFRYGIQIGFHILQDFVLMQLFTTYLLDYKMSILII